MPDNPYQNTASFFFRPEDDVFEDFSDLYATAKDHQQNSEVFNVNLKDLQVVVDEEKQRLTLNSNVNGGMTDWATRQLCILKRAPYSYLKTLSLDLSADCLNYNKAQKPLKAMLYDNGTKRYLRALTGRTYNRLWNYDLLDRVAPVVNRFEKTCMVCSDRDMMLFLTDNDSEFTVPGDKSPMKKGIIIWNSEVGSRTVGYQIFIYRHYCTNHCILGFESQHFSKHKHIGDIMQTVMGIYNVLENYETNVDTEVEAIKKMISLEYAKSEKDAIEKIRKVGFTKKYAEQAMEYVNEEFGGKLNVWSIYNGLTRASQIMTNHADDRLDLDGMASKMVTKILHKAA